LVSPLGEEVVTELVPPEPKKGSCYQMAVVSSEADPIESIKVVSEFPDVFPKDLPGMPPSLRELTEYLDQSWLNLRSRLMSC
jgi:hypothetical protein